jgi:hypothetical protein
MGNAEGGKQTTEGRRCEDGKVREPGNNIEVGMGNLEV